MTETADAAENVKTPEDEDCGSVRLWEVHKRAYEAIPRLLTVFMLTDLDARCLSNKLWHVPNMAQR